MQRILISALLTLLLALTGCSNDEGNRQVAAAATTDITATTTATADTNAPKRAALRVIMPRNLQGLEQLPRNGLPKTEEYHLLELYAEAANLEIVPVRIDDYNQLIPTLLEGKGDIVVDNLSVTEARKKQVSFTIPIAFVREQIVGRRGETPKTAHELGGRKIAVHRSDSFYGSLRRLLKQRFQPPFEIVEVDESIPTEAIISGVADGSYDLTVTDSNAVGETPAPGSGLEIGYDLSSVRPIAWAVHPDNNRLLVSVNEFLGRHHLAKKKNEPFTGDLAEIKKRKVLRVLTRNSASTYFLWRGELLGFEYELAKRFAEQNDLRLEMVVPPSRDLLIPWLKQGKGDLIAAAMTINEQRQTQGIGFSRPYHQVSELLVTRRDDSSLNTPEDLKGRTVVVRKSSAYWESLEALQQQGIKFALVAAPEEMETEELIARVADGKIDLTVADSQILDIEQTWRDDIQAAFPLGEPRSHGWIARKENPELLTAVNAFLKKEYRGVFYNVTYKKYFKNPKRILSHVEERADGGDNGLSPYDNLTRQYADRYGFDWRLVASQMYQESRFDPNAKSWVGALGLLQVMPRTAKEFGINDLRDPEQGVHAGVQYLDWLRKRFEPELPMADRTWLALAAYNAGVGHVRDARQLAAEKGWNPDKWFDNVEKAMLLLSKKEYATKAKHGYVRGHEPVNYVRQIRDRYFAYIKLKQQSVAQAD